MFLIYFSPITLVMKELRVLDLFSGIGGFSLALKSIARTVAYCEIEQSCRTVLTNNMLRGNIDKAPIFEDVTKLMRNDVQKLRPNMITAGFPCQDISAANPHGLGLSGARSGLFKEILRLVDELNTIDVLFLENSPRIITKGVKFIVRALRKRGYTVKYCVCAARDVGALHKRARWYCIAYRNGVDMRFKPAPDNPTNVSWKRPPSGPKVVRIKHKAHQKQCISRCGMLGNSIVPHCAAYAWNTLIGANEPTKQPSLPRSQNIFFDDGMRVVQRDYWATPTHRIWHSYRKITNRGIGLLCNQLYYSRCNTYVLPVDKPAMSHLYSSDPKFVEFLMGYPKGWTR
jgi:site-specific DNA-cytosine methylase